MSEAIAAHMDPPRSKSETMSKQIDLLVGFRASLGVVNYKVRTAGRLSKRCLDNRGDLAPMVAAVFHERHHHGISDV